MANISEEVNLLVFDFHVFVGILHNLFLPLDILKKKDIRVMF